MGEEIYQASEKKKKEFFSKYDDESIDDFLKRKIKIDPESMRKRKLKEELEKYCYGENCEKNFKF